jgi:hypothetical protein
MFTAPTGFVMLSEIFLSDEEMVAMDIINDVIAVVRVSEPDLFFENSTLTQLSTMNMELIRNSSGASLHVDAPEPTTIAGRTFYKITYTNEVNELWDLYITKQGNRMFYIEVAYSQQSEAIKDIAINSFNYIS